MGSYPGVRFFEELGQLYDYITQLEELDKALAKKAVSYYLTHDVELKNRIEQILRNKSCAVDGTTWDAMAFAKVTIMITLTLKM